MHALRPLLLLALVFTPVLAQAGGVGDWGTRPIRAQHTQRWSAQAQVSGVRWTTRTGRGTTVVLPRSVKPFEATPLVAPPGEWVELTLLLDGPMTLVGSALDWTLEIPEFTVILDEPVLGGAAVQLSLNLPEAGFPTRVRPGGIDHDALVVAVEDGASATR